MKILLPLIGPMLAIAAAVPAAADTVAVRYSDLNLASAEGVATLDARLNHAARQVCSSGSRDLSIQRAEAACRADVLASARGQARQIAAAQIGEAQTAAGR